MDFEFVRRLSYTVTGKATFQLSNGIFVNRILHGTSHAVIGYNCCRNLYSQAGNIQNKNFQYVYTDCVDFNNSTDIDKTCILKSVLADYILC
ncbi:MAG: hypothetical protein LBK06_05990 [Planctomycetaceae bacterium]|nr:hypothetical protein [Planctomycetaceae bacterium]